MKSIITNCHFFKMNLIQNRTTRFLLLFLSLSLSSLTLNAQGAIEPKELEPTSLDGRFNRMMGKSTNYQQYKVIKKTEIEDFWKSTLDTMRQKTKVISSLKSEIRVLQVRIDTLESRLLKLNSALASSNSLNDEIGFFGSTVKKSSYHWIVWGIIVILLTLAIVVYVMYMNSNAVTSRFKKESEKLRKEFDDHRDKSREAQVRLKRELQTAVNSIDEMKRGGGSRR